MIDYIRHNPLTTYLTASTSVMFAHVSPWVTWEHAAIVASGVAALAAAVQAGVQVYDRIIKSK